jgi:hypothetical protein
VTDDDIPHGLLRPSRRRRGDGSGRAGLAGEVFVVAVGVSLLSLAVVTFLPALAAGVEHVRRHVSARSDAVADLWRAFVAALRGVWPYAIGSVLLLALLGFNGVVAFSGRLPAGVAVGVVTVLALAALVVVMVRSAAAWRPEGTWRQAVRAGARRAAEDPLGSLLIVAALAVCVPVVWVVNGSAVLVPGLLAFSAAAVEARWDTRAGD